jgi:hypothetical protein
MQAEGLLPFAVGAAPAGCDVGVGEWVYDEAARPMYEEEACPYIQPHLTCQAHGRPDKSYQHWRWQPRGCDLPRSVHSGTPATAVLSFFFFAVVRTASSRTGDRCVWSTYGTVGSK